MDVWAALRALRNDLRKHVNLSHDSKLLDLMEGIAKNIDEVKSALGNLDTKVDNVGSKTTIIEKVSEVQQATPGVLKKTYYDDDRMFVPDVETSGAVVRAKETAASIEHTDLESGVDALDRALGGS